MWPTEGYISEGISEEINTEERRTWAWGNYYIDCLDGLSVIEVKSVLLY